MHTPTCYAWVKIPKETPLGNTEDNVNLEQKKLTEESC